MQQSVRAGTTALGEIAQPGRPLGPFEATGLEATGLEAAGLEATVFLELIAPTADRIAGLLQQAPPHARSGDPAGNWRPGLSPHAPYSVLDELFEAAVRLSADARVPIAFHLAESREEIQLLAGGSGPLAEAFEELGTCDPKLFAPGRRPLDYLRHLTKAHRTLVVHGNYLDDEEIALLADHAARMAVVYCPRTHAYFRHDPYPLQKMLAAGVTVALGTDSRASSPDLSVLEEMRWVSRHHPHVARDVVLQLGTIRGAAALGRRDEIGSLEPGTYADLAAVALPDHDAADPHELLFDSDQPVVATWYRGKRIHQ